MWPHHLFWCGWLYIKVTVYLSVISPGASQASQNSPGILVFFKFHLVPLWFEKMNNVTLTSSLHYKLNSPFILEVYIFAHFFEKTSCLFLSLFSYISASCTCANFLPPLNLFPQSNTFFYPFSCHEFIITQFIFFLWILIHKSSKQNMQMWKNTCNKKFREHSKSTHKGFTTSAMNMIISSGAKKLLSNYTKVAAEAWGTSLQRTKRRNSNSKRK